MAIETNDTFFFQGWTPMQAKLNDIGFSPATIAMGRYLFIMGGVNYLATNETIPLNEFVDNHTSRSLNVFDYFVNKLCQVTEISRDDQETAFHSSNIHNVGEIHLSEDNSLQTTNLTNSQKDQSNLTIKLDYPVVGVGSVVQMGSASYSFGFCNAIPEEVDVANSLWQETLLNDFSKNNYNNSSNRIKLKSINNSTGVQYLRSIQQLELFTKVHPEPDEVQVKVNSWQLPEEAMLRYNASCVGSKNGLVFIVGGVNALTGKELDSIAIYNVSSKEFVDAVITLPRSLVTPAVLAQSELIYIAGGLSRQSTASSHNSNNNNHTPTEITKEELEELEKEEEVIVINNNISAIDVTEQLFNPALASFDGDSLAWYEVQLFLYERTMIVMGNSHGMAYNKLLYWDDMTVHHGNSDNNNNNNNNNVFESVDINFAPKRRYSALAAIPATADSLRFYLFGGEVPSASLSSVRLPSEDIFSGIFHVPPRPVPREVYVEGFKYFNATTNTTSTNNTRPIHEKQLDSTIIRNKEKENTRNKVTRENTERDADHGSITEILTQQNYVYNNSNSAVNLPYVPNNAGNVTVFVNGYIPVWYNVSFNLLLSTSIIDGCPGLEHLTTNNDNYNGEDAAFTNVSLDSDSSTSKKDRTSTCYVQLSSSPQCSDAWFTFPPLSPNNTRRVMIDELDPNGTIINRVEAIGIHAIKLLGSLIDGFTSAISCPESNDNDNNNYNNSTDSKNNLVYVNKKQRKHKDKDNDDGKKVYRQMFLFACFSRGSEAIQTHTSIMNKLPIPTPTIINTSNHHSKTLPLREIVSQGEESKYEKTQFNYTMTNSPMHSSFHFLLNGPYPFVLSPVTDWMPHPEPSPLPISYLQKFWQWMKPHIAFLTVLLIVCLLASISVIVKISSVHVRIADHDVFAYYDNDDVDDAHTALLLMQEEEEEEENEISNSFDQADLLQRRYMRRQSARRRNILERRARNNNNHKNNNNNNNNILHRFWRGAHNNNMNNTTEQSDLLLEDEATHHQGDGNDNNYKWNVSCSLASHARRMVLDGKYQVLRKLGKGSFSVVYLVERLFDHRYFALKYVHCSDDVDRHEAMKECEVAYSLQGHPNVIQLVDMFMSYRFDQHLSSIGHADEDHNIIAQPGNKEINTHRMTHNVIEEKRLKVEEENKKKKKKKKNDGVINIIDRDGKETEECKEETQAEQSKHKENNLDDTKVKEQENKKENKLDIDNATGAIANVTMACVGVAESEQHLSEQKELLEHKEKDKEKEQQEECEHTIKKVGQQIRKKDCKDRRMRAERAVQLNEERYLSLVMAFYPKGDLGRWVIWQRECHRAIPEETIVSIAYQVLSVLAFMHHRNPSIIHRDLKPENILLASHAIYEDVSELFLPIVITDFGLSRCMDTTFCETGVGSLPYVAPECWQRRYSTKVDIWALGCILYAVASTRVASNTVKIMFSESARSGFVQRIHTDLCDKLKYSTAFAHFVTWLLQADPAQRPTAKAALAMIAKRAINTSNKNNTNGDDVNSINNHNDNNLENDNMNVCTNNSYDDDTISEIPIRTSNGRYRISADKAQFTCSSHSTQMNKYELYIRSDVISKDETIN